MIRALIFDCFGVLTTDGWLAFKEKYLLDDDTKLEAGTQLNYQADRGIIDQDIFVGEVAKLVGISSREARMVIDHHVRNDRLFERIGQLKSRFRIGLLSNVSADYTDELFTPEQNALFDAKTFSFELGIIKPHPAMYQTIASKLSMVPEECLLIDDREGFVTGAREVGMDALLFESTPQIMRAIEEKVG